MHTIHCNSASKKLAKWRFMDWKLIKKTLIKSNKSSITATTLFSGRLAKMIWKSYCVTALTVTFCHRKSWRQKSPRWRLIFVNMFVLNSFLAAHIHDATKNTRSRRNQPTSHLNCTKRCTKSLQESENFHTDSIWIFVFSLLIDFYENLIELLQFLVQCLNATFDVLWKDKNPNTSMESFNCRWPSNCSK